MRYEPAVGSFARFTLDDVEIHGWVVPRNRVLSLSTLAALTQRLPQLQLDGDPPVIRGNGGIRSVRNMRVRWTRTGP